MKKIICLILALACCFALFACGKTDETLEAFLASVNASEPTDITTLTTHTRGDVYYNGTYETVITENGFVFTYEYEEKAPVTADSTTGSVITKSGEIVYDGQKYLLNGEPTTAAPEVAYMSLTLNLTAQTIGEYRLSRDGNTITAEISADQVKAIFGTEISATTATLTVKLAGNRLSRVNLAYTTTDGTEVLVETSYTYTPTPATAE